MQAYITYLREVIEGQEDAAKLKDRMISLLQAQVEEQADIIDELTMTINKAKAPERRSRP